MTLNEPIVWRGHTAAQVEAQYFLRGLRPDYDVHDIPRWIERSAEFTASQPSAVLDVVYGTRDRNRLDVFPAADPTGAVVLYVHGGYWQRGDKSVYRFLAEPLLAAGVSVVLMSYQMCPDVAIRDIAPQTRAAVQWIWENADRHGFDRGRFSVMGHSAGGHQTVEMMFTDWSLEDSMMPPQVFQAGIALSGLFDLEPILHCSENDGLRMAPADAREASPLHRTPAALRPLLIGYGEHEPPDMHRQSQALYRALVDCHSATEIMVVEGVEHFDILNRLGDGTSRLCRRVLDLVV